MQAGWVDVHTQWLERKGQPALAPARFPRTREEWQRFAAWGYAAGGGMVAAIVWLFAGWVYASGGRPFDYQSGNTPVVLDTSDAGIAGFLFALVWLFGNLAVWWLGAAWFGFVLYTSLANKLVEQIGDRSTVIGAVLGSTVGVVIAIIALLLLLAWALVVAMMYALVVVAGYVLLTLIAGAVRR
jgi:hypothetical protein